MTSIRNRARTAAQVARRMAQARFVYPGRSDQAREAEAVRQLFTGEAATAHAAWHPERGCYVDRMGQQVEMQDWPKANEPDVKHWSNGYPEEWEEEGPGFRDLDPMTDPDGMPLVRVAGADMDRERGA